jgi:hypothetical protein
VKQRRPPATCSGGVHGPHLKQEDLDVTRRKARSAGANSIANGPHHVALSAEAVRGPVNSAAVRGLAGSLSAPFENRCYGNQKGRR